MALYTKSLKATAKKQITEIKILKKISFLTKEDTPKISDHKLNVGGAPIFPIHMRKNINLKKGIKAK